MQLFDEKYIISDDLINLNKIRILFNNIATKSREQWDLLYNSYGNIKVFSSNGLDDGYNIIFNAIEETVNLLIEHNILHIDKETFFINYYKSYYDWDNYFNKVDDEYHAIHLDQAEMDKYRTARRESRSTWSGGGFGLDGAIKGAVQAGGLNLIGGVAHGTVNIIGKTFDSIGNMSRERSVYNSDDNKNHLSYGIYINCFNIMKPFIKILNENTDNQIRVLSNSNYNYAKALSVNLLNDNFPKSEEIKTVYNI